MSSDTQPRILDEAEINIVSGGQPTIILLPKVPNIGSLANRVNAGLVASGHAAQVGEIVQFKNSP